MKATKIITPIAAIFLFLLAPVFSNAQICVIGDEKYTAEQAIIHKGDNLEFIKWCCEKAFNTNICEGQLSADGFLTHTAAKYKRYEVLRYLIDDLKMEYDYGNVKEIIPAMFAAESGYLPTTKYLVIDKGTNPTIKDKDGCDTLCYARKAKNPDEGLLELVENAWNERMGRAFNQDGETLKNTKEIKRYLTDKGVEKDHSYINLKNKVFFGKGTVNKS